MNNIFQRLGSSFGCEDFFTAAIALFVERNPKFRDAFLTWLEQASGESLLHRNWQVEIQSGSPSCAGTAVLDMKLRHPEVELWFEHKVGAPVGKRKSAVGRDLDQLEKYLDAAARVICGLGGEQLEVEWPAVPVAGQPRVLLFYISRGGAPLRREVYARQLHQPGSYGLVWPAAGPLRWRDFWPQAQFALEPVLQGEQGEFERTLTHQFLLYWQSLPGMWQTANTVTTWREAHTKDEQGNFPSEPLWDGILQLAREKLGWPRYGGYKIDHYLAVPSGPIEDVMVSALTSRSEMPVDSQGMPDEVIRLQFKLRDNSLPRPAPAQRLCFDRWRGVTALGSTRDRNVIRVFVSVLDWPDALTQDQRTRALIGSFVAGVKMFEQLTGWKLPGTEQI